MFDIIRQTRSYDFGRMYSQAGLDSIPRSLRVMVETDNTNWMSSYNASITKFETLLDNLVEALKD